MTLEEVWRSKSDAELVPVQRALCRNPYWLGGHYVGNRNRYDRFTKRRH
jgi:hypothetical protein